MAPLIPAAIAGSSALSAIGAIRAGATEAAVANANAQTAQINAGTAMNSGEAEAARIERSTARTVATASNTIGANGIQTSGSALDVMGDLSAQGALDAQIARWRASTQSDAYQATADQQKAAAAAAPTTALINAGTSLLSGASRYASQRAYAQGLISPPGTTS